MRNTALGYRIVNGKAVIDEKEAIIVRELYRNYLDGMSLCASAENAAVFSNTGFTIPYQAEVILHGAAVPTSETKADAP